MPEYPVIAVRVPPDLLARIDAEAERREVDRSALLRAELERLFAERPVLRSV